MNMNEKKSDERHRSVLIAQHDVIDAFVSAGCRQVNVRPTRDPLHCLILKHLKACTQTQYDAGTHCITGLGKQIKRCPCQMIKRQLVKHGGQLPLTVLRKQLIYGGEMLHIGASCPILVNEQDQRLQEISFAVVPEVIAFTRAGVADNDIGQYLRHQRVAVQV